MTIQKNASRHLASLTNVKGNPKVESKLMKIQKLIASANVDAARDNTAKEKALDGAKFYLGGALLDLVKAFDQDAVRLAHKIVAATKRKADVGRLERAIAAGLIPQDFAPRSQSVLAVSSRAPSITTQEAG